MYVCVCVYVCMCVFVRMFACSCNLFVPVCVAVYREEFVRNGQSGLVTVTQQDVHRDGFGPSLFSKADAVFLDLPEPWLAGIVGVSKFLDPLKNIVCFL